MIVLVEHRTLTRECLTRCLRQLSATDIVVGVATIEEWIGAGHGAPGAIILCVDGHGATRAVIEQYFFALAAARCSAPVAVLADGEDADLILELLDVGAKGFIPTSVSIEVLIEAIRLVRAGGTFVPASSLLASRSRIEQPASRTKARVGNIFTERQSAVVEMLRQGKANKIIAYELNMRESTVKVHIRNIMRKLNATNRTQVAYLYQSMIPQGSPPS